MKIRLLVSLLASAGLLSAADAPAAKPVMTQPGHGISAARILERVKVLSSDEFEGRAPGSAGEEKTVAYLVEQFKKIGLQPGNPDGTYVQRVPLVGITPDPGTTLVLNHGDREQRLKFKDDVVAWTKRVLEQVSLEESEVEIGR